MKLKKNIGTPGRLIRLAIGILLLGYAYWQMSWIALVLALFTFFEAFMSWCILYQILGKNSCPRK
ncbi:MAG TPA: DUF2892 domain-containing protein [Rhabdochlamydiaceae bacterium]|jgi:ABC-type uncharacterized transport system permease subunit|nr:DUF2892 domain-containing protein [Rhabdochlamydiaceae bacterium]